MYGAVILSPVVVILELGSDYLLMEGWFDGGTALLFHASRVFAFTRDSCLYSLVWAHRPRSIYIVSDDF